MLAFDKIASTDSVPFTMSVRTAIPTEEAGLALMAVDQYVAADGERPRRSVTIETFTVEDGNDRELAAAFFSHRRLEFDASGKVLHRELIARNPLEESSESEFQLKVDSANEPAFGPTTQVHLMSGSTGSASAAVFSSQLQGQIAVGIVVRNGHVIAGFVDSELNPRAKDSEVPPRAVKPQESDSPHESEPIAQPQPKSGRGRLAQLPE